MPKSSTLFRVRIDTQRLKKAEKIFKTLGLKPGDAVNLFFAQVALRKDLPFDVTTRPQRLQSDLAQAKEWTEALGDY